MNPIFSKPVAIKCVKSHYKLWCWLTGALSLLAFFVVLTLGREVRRDKRNGFPAFLDDEAISRIFFGEGGLVFMLAFVLIVRVANALVATDIDRGTMSLVLNTPTSRLQIILTRMCFYILTYTLMVVIVAAIAGLMGAAFGIDINFVRYGRVILGFSLLLFCTGGISFLSSCWFNKSGFSMAFGAGIPIVFIFLNAFSPIIKLGGKEFLRYLSINTLYNLTNIVDNHNYVAAFITLFLIGAALYTAGVIKFLKKDLPL
jgi:ABC-type transport system involved in multi-copper enzyme maturation permease subunit